MGKHGYKSLQASATNEANNVEIAQEVNTIKDEALAERLFVQDTFQQRQNDLQQTEHSLVTLKKGYSGRSHVTTSYETRRRRIVLSDQRRRRSDRRRRYSNYCPDGKTPWTSECDPDRRRRHVYRHVYRHMCVDMCIDRLRAGDPYRAEWRKLRTRSRHIPIAVRRLGLYVRGTTDRVAVPYCAVQ